MRRRVVLWDVMSTLVRDPFYDDIPRFFGMTLAELIEAKHDATWPRFERGHIDEHELARTFFSDGRAFDLPGLKDAMRDGYAWLPGIEPLLRTLSAAGVEMHTLSNYPAWFRMIEQRLGVGRLVVWKFVLLFKCVV
jgi:FMN phosphatase YigB (HAD superfamily)